MPPSAALYSISEIRDIEHAAQAVLPAGSLMQRAGKDAAAFALEILAENPHALRVLVLAGPGNNGGDAFEVAWHLFHAGFETCVLSCGDPIRLPPDAQAALSRMQSCSLRCAALAEWESVLAEPWHLVVDGLFGIGLARPVTGALRKLVEAVNQLPCPVLALDVPSGLDADTGNIVGAHAGVAIRASHTVTFIGDKPGLHTAHGRDFAGIVRIATLDIDDALYPPYRLERNDPGLFSPFLRRRNHNSHKGSFGDVTVIGGAHGMSGAIILAARTAARCGAGRVFAAFLDEAPPYDPIQPELMCRQAASIDLANGTLVVGPGLGTSPAARAVLEQALSVGNALVLDADALNLIATDQELQGLSARHPGPLIMTPHPLEAARLLGIDSRQVQDNRCAAAQALTDRFRCSVVLKGSGTVIATPNRRIAINTSGNPALATAGTGDILAGVCGALLAQGLPGHEAALAATWLHGHAADRLVRGGNGPVGLTASELIPEIRSALNTLIEQYARHHLPR